MELFIRHIHLTCIVLERKKKPTYEVVKGIITANEVVFIILYIHHWREVFTSLGHAKSCNLED